MQGETFRNPRDIQHLARELNKQLIQVAAVDERVDRLEARLAGTTELDPPQLFAASLMYCAMVDILGDRYRADMGIARLPVRQQERIRSDIALYKTPVNGGLYILAPGAPHIARRTAEQYELALLLPRENLKLAGIDYLRQLVDDDIFAALGARHHAVGLTMLARIGLLHPSHPSVRGRKKTQLVRAGFRKRLRVNGLTAVNASVVQAALL